MTQTGEQLTTFSSGERVITERLDRVRSVAIGFWIGTGSRDEQAGRAGVTHFLEHLLFRGTRSYSALEIAEVFDGIGGELNAMTGREYTVVVARVLDDHLETAVDVMAEMVYAPTLAELDAEREVVLEEIAMVEDAPHDLVHDLFGVAVFGEHELGRPVLGSADVISSVSRRSLRAYHRSRYASPRIVVAAAGSVDHDRFAGLVASRIAETASGSSRNGRALLASSPQPSLVFNRKSTEQYHVCVGGTGLARADERRFAASVLDGILGGSPSSRLFQEIRERRGLAYSVYTFASMYQETGEVGVYVGTREEHVGTCLGIIAEQIGDLAQGGVGEAELRRAKENLKGRIMLSLESTSNRVTRLGKSLITDMELLTPEEVIARVDAVSADQVAALAAELHAPERLAVAGIGPSVRVIRAAARRVNPALGRERAA